MSKPSGEWTEAEALQVLNDSPWARPATTSVQDSQCDYAHPAFEGTLDPSKAARLDSGYGTYAAVPVQPDGAQYVIRLSSARPMQAAAERLVQLDPKWVSYDSGIVLEPGLKPTNLKEQWYNPADEIHVSVVLKRSGPGGASFVSYAFGLRDHHESYKEKYAFPGGGPWHIWPCAGIRTPEGQVSAVAANFGEDEDRVPSAIYLSFPSVFKGRPLVSQPNEKVEFRFIANQRVFEAAFVVNPLDLILNEPEKVVLRLPPTVDEPKTSSSR